MRLSLLYYLWLFANLYMVFASGYIDKVMKYFNKFPLVEVSWRKFVEHSEVFYPFQSLDKSMYDITEFFLYLLLPLFVYNLFKPKGKFKKVDDDSGVHI